MTPHTPFTQYHNLKIAIGLQLPGSISTRAFEAKWFLERYIEAELTSRAKNIRNRGLQSDDLPNNTTVNPTRDSEPYDLETTHTLKIDWHKELTKHPPIKWDRLPDLDEEMMKLHAEGKKPSEIIAAPNFQRLKEEYPKFNTKTISRRILHNSKKPTRPTAGPSAPSKPNKRQHKKEYSTSKLTPTPEKEAHTRRSTTTSKIKGKPTTKKPKKKVKDREPAVPTALPWLQPDHIPLADCTFSEEPFAFLAKHRHRKGKEPAR